MVISKHSEEQKTNTILFTSTVQREQCWHVCICSTPSVREKKQFYVIEVRLVTEQDYLHAPILFRRQTLAGALSVYEHQCQ